MPRKSTLPTLRNPFKAPRKIEFNIPGEIARATGGYEEAMQEGYDLIELLRRARTLEYLNAVM